MHAPDGIPIEIPAEPAADVRHLLAALGVAALLDDDLPDD